VEEEVREYAYFQFFNLEEKKKTSYSLRKRGGMRKYGYLPPSPQFYKQKEERM